MKGSFSSIPGFGMSLTCLTFSPSLEESTTGTHQMTGNIPSPSFPVHCDDQIGLIFKRKKGNRDHLVSFILFGGMKGREGKEGEGRERRRRKKRGKGRAVGKQKDQGNSKQEEEGKRENRKWEEGGGGRRVEKSGEGRKGRKRKLIEKEVKKSHQTQTGWWLLKGMEQRQESWAGEENP